MHQIMKRLIYSSLSKINILLLSHSSKKPCLIKIAFDDDDSDMQTDSKKRPTNTAH